MQNLKAGMTTALLTVAIAVSSGAARSETIADALTAAYNNSGLLEQNRALLRAADEDVAQSVAALRPIIGYLGSVQRDYGTRLSEPFAATGFGTTDVTASLTADLLIYDGGVSRLAVEAAKETVLSVRQQLISAEQSVLQQAAIAYIDVIRESEVVDLRINNLRLLEEELRAAQNRFEVGEVTRTDVALAEAQRASAQANLAAARGALDVARERYRAAVGREPGNLTGITNLPNLERDEATAKQIAMLGHPDLRAIQFEANAAELNIRRAEAARNPTVSLRGEFGVQQRFESENFAETGRVGVNLSGPIYQGGAISATIRQAMARRDAVRGQLIVAQDAIRQNVGTALAQLRVADALITATREQIRAAEVAFRGVREEAQLGQRTTLDVLIAEQDLLDARTDLANALADRNSAVFEYLEAQGLLTTEYLRLPVQRYDPVEYYNLVRNAPARSYQGDQLDRVLRSIGQP